jgi:hypothetical protein
MVAISGPRRISESRDANKLLNSSVVLASKFAHAADIDDAANFEATTLVPIKAAMVENRRKV